ncbi:hypothetical protein DFH07DRAFT_772862 [Mycena maculata]|uniref:Uncharacterized protein n=1 Tax=Mycena maculata TaxID=230809 RepID=A0AAD7J555_9AGAR|nr:hypothetical protein DFH07DRAFT_772862 [Mycena maculata]
MVSTRSTYTPSPTQSENLYWDSVDGRDTPSPAPSQTADAFGWDSEASLGPMDSTEATPTQQTVRPSSPASVVEISMEDFPPLVAPAPAATAKPHAKATKAPKGKGRAKAATNNDEDPFLVADIARAAAASLGLTTALNQATEGASSSRRPAAAPGSPPKRLRANTTGDAAPAPFAANAQAPAPPATFTPSAANVTTAPAAAVDTVPVAAAVTMEPAVVLNAAAPAMIPVAAAPTAVPVIAAPAAAPVVAPVIAAPVTIAPVTVPVAVVLAAAPVAVPVVAPAAIPVQPAAAAALPPMWLMANGLPPRGSYTPTPAGGFPNIIYSAEQLLAGILDILLQKYDEVNHPKFFIVVSGGNGTLMRTHGLIREAIGGFINIDPTSFTLGTPPTASNGSSPALWLAADIRDDLVQGIVNNRIISSANITLYPLPYNMPVSGFIGVFSSFTLPNSDTGANAARDLLRTAIASSNEIAQFVQTHRDAFGPQVSVGEAWDIVLASVAVHPVDLLVNGTNTVAWRLYINPPTNDRTHWGQLCRLFGKVQIMTALYGTARLQRTFHCPSTDHPTPLCPLPGLPGWHGSTPTTIAALEEASRAAASKAQEQMHANSFAAGGAGSNSGNGRGHGATDKKPHGDGKKKDFKGKGKRCERDDFF